MKRYFRICVGALLMTGLASAASAEDPSAGVRSWTACFVGVHTGAAFSLDKIRSSSDFSSVGVIGGGQIGCDYQFASGLVVGSEVGRPGPA